MLLKVRRTGLLTAGALLLATSVAWGSAVEISPSHQAKILLAGLSFFRQLPADGGNLNVMLIGTCPVAQALSEFEGKSVNSLALRFEMLGERPSETILDERLAQKSFAALYDCHTQGEQHRKTAAIALRHKVMHLGPDLKAVEHGAVLATEVQQGRPGLVLNMASVKSLGVTFDGRLSGVARFIQ